MVLSHIKIRQNLKLSVLKLETHYNILLRPTNKLQPGRMFPSNFFECYFFHKLRADPFFGLFIKFSGFREVFQPSAGFFFSVENEAVFLLFPCFWWKDERSTNRPKVEYDTVDGSEILRSAVEVGSLSHDLQGFSTVPARWWSTDIWTINSITVIFELTCWG